MNSYGAVFSSVLYFLASEFLILLKFSVFADILTIYGFLDLLQYFAHVSFNLVNIFKS